MKVVYITTKSMQVKQYTMWGSHQLGLEVEKPEKSTKFSFFAILHNKSTEWKTYCFYAIFSANIYRAGGSFVCLF